MTIEKTDFANWRMSDSNFAPDVDNIRNAMRHIEVELGVELPKEYQLFLSLINDKPIVPNDGKEYCLARYDHGVRRVHVAVLSSSRKVIERTTLSRESIYDERHLLAEGLIVIGSTYDGDTDACLVYDTRPDSPTYSHVFNWRYYVDNLVLGEGLGLLAHSLKEFLNTPTAVSEL